MAVGDYWYNSDSGSVTQQTVPGWLGGDLEAHLGLGWHGPFKTKQAALDYYNLGKAANPGWKAPTGVLGTIENTVPGVSQIAGATNWFGANIETLFIRVGEVLLGLLLIGIGVASITGTSNFVSKAVRSKL